MLDYKYDTQLLIEGKGLNEDEIREYFMSHFEGDCLLAVGDENLVKIHFHTGEPWKVLAYCASQGEISMFHVKHCDFYEMLLFTLDISYSILSLYFLKCST